MGVAGAILCYSCSPQPTTRKQAALPSRQAAEWAKRWCVIKPGGGSGKQYEIIFRAYSRDMTVSLLFGTRCPPPRLRTLPALSASSCSRPGSWMDGDNGLMRKIALIFIRIYQNTISRVTPPSCRFTPTCSHYTYEAIEKYGFLKGGWMGLKRISRCHPWHPGGYDPVP